MRFIYDFAASLDAYEHVVEVIVFAAGFVVTAIIDHWKKGERKRRIGRYFIGILLSLVFVGAIWSCDNYYDTHYIFPNVIKSKLDDTSAAIYDLTGRLDVILTPEGFPDDDDSYVFEVKTADGETVEANDLLNKDREIYLYTTFYYEKIDSYLVGEVTLEEMREVTLDSIVAEYTGDTLYVGQDIDKSAIKVVASYSNGQTETVDINECSLDRTQAENTGRNIIQVSWSGMTCEFTVEVREPVLTSITVEYAGELQPREGDTLDPADFIVYGNWSTGQSTRLGQGDFTFEPQVVEAGDNKIEVTYQTKTGNCVVTALGAEDVYPIKEEEPNDSASAAQLISIPCSFNASVSSDSDVDVYEIKLPEAGEMSISLVSYIDRTYLKLYSLSNTETAIWESGIMEWNENLGVLKTDMYVHLSAGTYYLEVGEDSRIDNFGGAEYSIELGFEAACVTITLPHSSYSVVEKQETGIALDETILDQISLTEWNKFFKFTLGADSKIVLSTISYMPYISWLLYQEGNSTAIDQQINEQRNDAGVFNGEYAIYLKAGTYYLQFGCRHNNTEASNTGNFQFSVSAAECGTDTDTLTAGSWVSAMIPVNETSSAFTFTLSSGKTVQLSYDTKDKIRIRILTNNGNQRWDRTIENESGNTGELELNSGTYTVIVDKRNDRGASFSLCLGY